MSSSVSDKAKRDASNGTYDPPPANAPQHQVHLYDRVWDLETQKQRRTDRY